VLVGDLLTDGRHVVAVDISATALDSLAASLGSPPSLQTVVADARTYVPSPPVDAWQDRAVFHFLVDDDDRASYVASAAAGVRPAGHLLIATFAPDGPEQCSGLPVRRHSVDELADTFATHFTLVDGFTDEHHTPWDAVQVFSYALLIRR
jgi:SAM-dependent methyltransferase